MKVVLRDAIVCYEAAQCAPVVLRWNPHAYTPAPGRRRANRDERLHLFTEAKRCLRTVPNATFGAPIVVVYMFYDRNNPQICRNLPHCFVDTADDLAHIASPRAWGSDLR